MKSKWFALFVGSSFAIVEVLHGQGTFQNLDFESASIPLDQPPLSFVSPGVAFPGWSVYVGSNSANSVVYNATALSAANISILASNYSPRPALDGRFSAYLQGSAHDNFGNFLKPWEVSLCQTGLVAAAIQSLRFISGPTSPFSSILVTLNGEELPLVLLGSTPDLTLYGADVSSFAGQVAELRFTARAFYPPPSIGYPEMNAWMLDSINFSDQPIPEPGTSALLGLGALLLVSGIGCGAGSYKKKPGSRQLPPSL